MDVEAHLWETIRVRLDLRLDHLEGSRLANVHRFRRIGPGRLEEATVELLDAREQDEGFEVKDERAG
jgi:hypothetical protein